MEMVNICADADSRPLSELLTSLQSVTPQNVSSTNVCIICSDGYIPVHSFVLEMASPYFERILTGYYNQKIKSDLISIVMPDFRILDMRKVVQLMYRGFSLTSANVTASEMENLQAILKIFEMDKNPAVTLDPAQPMYIDESKGLFPLLYYRLNSLTSANVPTASVVEEQERDNEYETLDVTATMTNITVNPFDTTRYTRLDSDSDVHPTMINRGFLNEKMSNKDSGRIDNNGGAGDHFDILNASASAKSAEFKSGEVFEEQDEGIFIEKNIDNDFNDNTITDETPEPLAGCPEIQPEIDLTEDSDHETFNAKVIAELDKDKDTDNKSNHSEHHDTDSSDSEPGLNQKEAPKNKSLLKRTLRPRKALKKAQPTGTKKGKKNDSDTDSDYSDSSETTSSEDEEVLVPPKPKRGRPIRSNSNTRVASRSTRFPSPSTITLNKTKSSKDDDLGSGNDSDSDEEATKKSKKGKGASSGQNKSNKNNDREIEAENVVISDKSSREEDDGDDSDCSDKKLKRFMEDAKRCGKCGVKYSSAKDASHCVTTKHKLVRCYYCFKVFNNTEKLFEHYPLAHTKASKDKHLLCQFCKQNISYKSVSTHVISNHLFEKKKTEPVKVSSSTQISGNANKSIGTTSNSDVKTSDTKVDNTGAKQGPCKPPHGIGQMKLLRESKKRVIESESEEDEDDDEDLMNDDNMVIKKKTSTGQKVFILGDKKKH